MNIPLSITMNTGDQETVQKTIDDFFQDTIELVLKQVGNQERRYLEIRVQNLYDSQRTILNDRVNLLLYRQRVIAIVSETRNDFNHVVYDFFRNLETLTKNST